TKKPSLTIFKDHIAVNQLDFTGAQTFDLPPEQYNAGFDAIMKLKIEFRFFIEGNGSAAAGLFLFGHELSVSIAEESIRGGIISAKGPHCLDLPDLYSTSNVATILN